MNNRVSYRSYRLNNNVEVRDFEKLSDIENILKKLEERIKTNGHTTLADYYELTGGVVIDGDSRTGWTDLMGVNIISGRYGHTLIMPVAKPIYIEPTAEIRTAIDILDNADSDSLEDAVNDAREILNGMLV